MNRFLEIYEKDAAQAKQIYYKAKLEIDIGTEEGALARKKMLSKYLEGLQWVLYYYYRGA